MTCITMDGSVENQVDGISGSRQQRFVVVDMMKNVIMMAAAILSAKRSFEEFVIITVVKTGAATATATAARGESEQNCKQDSQTANKSSAPIDHFLSPVACCTAVLIV